jgi:undecaprenyl-diphosphatase
MKKISIYKTLICIVSSLGFALVTVNVLNGNLDIWNISVYNQIALTITPMLTNFMVFIDFIGKWYIYLSIAGLLLLLPKTRQKLGFPVTFTLGFGMSLNYLFKQIFAVPRPDVYWLVNATGYGHPSGHIMYGTAFIGICVYLCFQYASKAATTRISLMLAIIFLLLMGFNRIYLGVHTPTDVIAGYFAGIFVLTLSTFIIQHRLWTLLIQTFFKSK